MPQHEVRMQVPARTQVVNSDVVFAVYADKKKLGDLKISKGTIDWKPTRRQNALQLTWEQFDQRMSETAD